ncbi:MAG TPA: hypothetical protein VG675_19185 [Bryobacteraceae bacterium]|nr:hypothetical protein [Bryobacteraceae bacterium]
MRCISSQSFFTAAFVTASFLAMSGLVLAQDQADEPAPSAQAQQQSTNGVWRRVGDPPPAVAQADPNTAQSPQVDPTEPVASPDDQDQAQAQPPQAAAEQAPPRAVPAPPARPDDPAPSQLTIKPGTFVTVRIDQLISSDRNHVGDTFSATLAQPIIVDGIVVARRGQTLGGRVAEAEKAGRVSGTSRLGIQLIDLTLADGQQVPIRSQMIQGSGGTTVGRDVAAVGGTTALGAAVGATADWGRGAAIGAAAGAAAGTIGVLLTRGRPTEIYPESLVTFRIESAVPVNMTRAPQAFLYAGPGDYNAPGGQIAQGPPRLAPRYAACAGCVAPPPPPPYYYYGPGYYPYGPGYYPFYYGPSVSFFYGPSFYRGRGFHRGVVIRRR